ncbi:Arc family DNA-binding protein [Gluconobacter oxydans]|uniref:Arc family DNA-binding protein n=1 Tax=Gluconobacter oxydans TaxID=442 RepID=UPI001CD8310F|nr:Arc family DNA-binding protein [Gluconobacter oxydans]
MADEDRYTRITLRIPKELTALLKAAADDSSHSMNAEIVQRLEQSFHNDAFIEVNDDMAEVNLTLAMDMFEWKKEILDSVENDPAATEIEKAIASHEFDKAQRHMRSLFSAVRLSAPLKAELAKRKIR